MRSNIGTTASGASSDCALGCEPRAFLSARSVELHPSLILHVTGERLSGTLLAWIRDPHSWHAVVSHSRRMESCWMATYEHAVPAEGLEPR